MSAPNTPLPPLHADSDSSLNDRLIAQRRYPSRPRGSSFAAAPTPHEGPRRLNPIPRKPAPIPAVGEGRERRREEARLELPVHVKTFVMASLGGERIVAVLLPLEAARGQSPFPQRCAPLLVRSARRCKKLGCARVAHSHRTVHTAQTSLATSMAMGQRKAGSSAAGAPGLARTPQREGRQSSSSSLSSRFLSTCRPLSLAARAHPDIPRGSPAPSLALYVRNESGAAAGHAPRVIVMSPSISEMFQDDSCTPPAVIPTTGLVRKGEGDLGTLGAGEQKLVRTIPRNSG